MAMQNIYDNDTFFAGYEALRQNPASANRLFELPALLSLLPDLQGKTVLDLGCGFGEHCTQYVRAGASAVVGVDLSEKMLEVARRENADPRIRYLHLPMEQIGTLEGQFDLVVSSLALHYVEDYGTLVRDVYALLERGGAFVFSQEHPLTTCHAGGERWTRDAQGRKLHANLANYGREGERESTWFVDGVKKYHRTFATVLNTLTHAGFTVEELAEPLPTPELLAQHPEYADLYHKPDFLLVRARK